MKSLTRIAALGLLSCPLAIAHATDLMDVWQAAQGHAPDAQLAQAAHAVGEARRSEAATLWKPSVSVSASAGIANEDTATHGAQFAAPGFGQVNGANFSTSINGGTTAHLAIEARQPLLNRARRTEAHQLELGGDLADQQWMVAHQGQMLQTASQYFDAVLAEERLRVLRREQLAVEFALSEMRDRFAAGDRPITDTHEAGARAEAIRAEVLSAESDAEYCRAVLAEAMGSPVAPGLLARPAVDPPLSAPEPLDSWLQATRDDSPALRAEEISIAVARDEAEKLSADAAPTVDLVSALSRDRLSGSGSYGSASYAAGNGMIGVQVTIPLYTGGNRSARQTEALRLADQAAAKASLVRNGLELQVRHAWLDLNNAPARLRALAAAVQASQARLASTRTGREVGDRTTLDLLNAENDAARAALALIEGRVNVLLARLRLSQLAGHLDDAQLQSINSLLSDASPD